VTGSFYAVRYQAQVALKHRKHAPTVGRFETWVDAEDHRLAQFNSDLLEVVTRTEED
jgi:hypothetical protein